MLEGKDPWLNRKESTSNMDCELHSQRTGHSDPFSGNPGQAVVESHNIWGGGGVLWLCVALCLKVCLLIFWNDLIPYDESNQSMYLRLDMKVISQILIIIHNVLHTPHFLLLDSSPLPICHCWNINKHTPKYFHHEKNDRSCCIISGQKPGKCFQH